MAICHDERQLCWPTCSLMQDVRAKRIGAGTSHLGANMVEWAQFKVASPELGLAEMQEMEEAIGRG
ncbi:hypothetical protein E2562_029866 [Oryza meyeriana var. granulata]|uniref:Uncharacterized protein n=1 Tax=Oryza meyeriana var. granulata TaxID=110450 RepID=A0A6G1ER71_9ORYZ|nr:hypothetical protein E2562_029866 [Oryza meyeriana var. granulata]